MSQETDNQDEMNVEPMGVAAGVGGALIKSGPFDKLLGPLAEAYGDEWGRGVRERIERKRKRREANARYQIALAVAAAKSAGRRPLDDLSDEDTFEEWLKGISEVDPYDEELSAVWQATLLEMQNSVSRGKSLLKIVKEMSVIDVELFLKVARAHSRFALGGLSGRPYPTRLVRLGLVSTVGDQIVSATPLVIMCLLTVILVSTVFGGFISKSPQNAHFGYITLAIVAADVTGTLFLLAASILQPKLTDEGQILFRLTKTILPFLAKYKVREKGEEQEGKDMDL